MIAIADQGRQVLYGLPALNGPDQTLPAFYALGGPKNSPQNYSTYFHDITMGNNFYSAALDTTWSLVSVPHAPIASYLLSRRTR